MFLKVDYHTFLLFLLRLVFTYFGTGFINGFFLMNKKKYARRKMINPIINRLQFFFLCTSSSSSILSVLLIRSFSLVTCLRDWALRRLSWTDLVWSFPLTIFIRGDSIYLGDIWAYWGLEVVVYYAKRGDCNGLLKCKGGGANFVYFPVAFVTIFLFSSINLFRAWNFSWLVTAF